MKNKIISQALVEQGFNYLMGHHPHSFEVDKVALAAINNDFKSTERWNPVKECCLDSSSDRNSFSLYDSFGNHLGHNPTAACWAQHSWRGEIDRLGFLLWPVFSLDEQFDTWFDGFMDFVYTLPLVRYVMVGSYSDVKRRGYHLFNMGADSNLLRYVMILLRSSYEFYQTDHDNISLYRAVLDTFPFNKDSDPAELFDFLIQLGTVCHNNNHNVCYFKSSASAQFVMFTLFGTMDVDLRATSPYVRSHYGRSETPASINALHVMFAFGSSTEVREVSPQGNVRSDIENDPAHQKALKELVKKVEELLK